MGVLPTPAEGEVLADSYREASEVADFVPVWGRPSPFYEVGKDLSGSWGRTFLVKYIRANGMFPVLCVSLLGPNMTLQTPPGLEGSSLADQRWREAYLDAVIEVVRSSRPLFLCVANEVNRWYERYGSGSANPNGFQHLVSLYEEIYDAVKAVSPETRVFCTFAREIVSENREADLGVLCMFDPERMDLLVLTSYPFAVRGINSPSDIPDDYYLEAAKYLPGKPLGFAEVGWPSSVEFGGQRGQADFLEQVSGRLTTGQGLDLLLLGYCWLHDITGGDALGLICRNGTRKLGYETWAEMFSGTHTRGG